MTSRLRFLGALAASMLLASCAPEAATEQGREIHWLYNFFLYVAAVVFVVVAGLIGWSIVRFRERPQDEGLPVQTHTNLALEVTWFAIPTVLVIVLFILSVTTDRRLGHEEEPDLTVEVESFQWGWTFDYGNGALVESLPQSQAEILLPIDTPIRFELRTADVVHSFYVPRFLNKRDMVPGRINEIDVTLDRAGTYRGVCAEFCGLYHDKMNFTVRAVPAPVFEDWIDSVRAEGAG